MWRLGSLLVAVGRTFKIIEKSLVFQCFWGSGASRGSVVALLGRRGAILKRFAASRSDLGASLVGLGVILECLETVLKTFEATGGVWKHLEKMLSHLRGALALSLFLSFSLSPALFYLQRGKAAFPPPCMPLSRGSLEADCQEKLDSKCYKSKLNFMQNLISKSFELW